MGQGAVRAAGVVGDGEGIQQGLQLREGCRLVRLGAEPVLQGLLEPLYLSLGLGLSG